MTMSSKKISKSLHSTLIAWGNARTSNGLTACAVNEITQPSNAHWRTYVGSLREQKIPCPPSSKPSKPTPPLVKSWMSFAPSLVNIWNPPCSNRGCRGLSPLPGCGVSPQNSFYFSPPQAASQRENTNMHWLELTVQTHPEAVESVSELLNRYTTGGVAIEEPIELVDEGQEYRVLTGQPVT